MAGQVEATGKDVTRFQPGDEVMGTGEGSFAEYARAREDKLAPKPAEPHLRAGGGRPDFRIHCLAGCSR